MKNSDWLQFVMWLGAANQSALFQSRKASYNIGSWTKYVTQHPPKASCWISSKKWLGKENYKSTYCYLPTYLPTLFETSKDRYEAVK